MTRGRPKKFDEQTALQAAMEVFWRRGYEAASCDELLEAMGINCGSMYSSFGDKEALFEKAFDLYADTVFSHGVAVLDGPGTPLENVRQLVGLWGQFMSAPECKGCLVENALIEFGKGESKVAARARQLMGQVQEKFREKIAAAVAEGELRDSVNPDEMAAFLVNTVHGLSVMARAGTGKEAIEGVINTTLSVLE